MQRRSACIDNSFERTSPRALAGARSLRFAVSPAVRRMVVVPLMGRISVGIVIAILVMACGPKKLPFHWNDELHLEIDTSERQTRPGVRLPVRCILANGGSKTFRACLSDARRYLTSTPEGDHYDWRGDQDHFFCKIPIVIAPKHSRIWIEPFVLAAGSPGTWRIKVWAPIVDPATCDIFGCETALFESNAFEVTIVSR